MALLSGVKKRFVFILCILLASLFLCPTVLANSPAPPDNLCILLQNVPSQAVYADLLVKFKDEDANYVSINNSNLEACSLSDDAPIALYDQDGYQSFTFHYKNAVSDIKISSTDFTADDGTLYCSVTFCKGIEYREFLTQYEDLMKNYSDIKIALLDAVGNILSVSSAFTLPQSNMFHNFYGTFYYDVKTDTVNQNMHLNYAIAFLLYGILFIALFIFLSAGIEVLIAIPFQFKGRRLGTIFLINVLTQLGMRSLHFLLPLPYLVNILLLEALVYTVEYCIYVRIFKDIPRRKILLYTVVANTASLAVGLVLYKFIL